MEELSDTDPSPRTPKAAPKGVIGPLVDAYTGMWDDMTGYWRRYGGSPAIATSPYLHLSLVIALICAVVAPRYHWWQTSIDVVPSMLGFSLAGYAILMALGAGPFQEILARAGGREGSVLGIMSASYVHFVVVQAIALCGAIVADALHSSIATSLGHLQSVYPILVSFVIFSLGVLGYLFVLYPIACGLGATFWVYRQVQLYIEFAHRVREKSDNQDTDGHDPAKSRQ